MLLAKNNLSKEQNSIVEKAAIALQVAIIAV